MALAFGPFDSAPVDAQHASATTIHLLAKLVAAVGRLVRIENIYGAPNSSGYVIAAQSGKFLNTKAPSTKYAIGPKSF
jgi:hypothetical protein